MCCIPFLQISCNYIIITILKLRGVTLKVNIISIGNSKGIRIPKILLEQVHLNKEADLVVEGAKLVIRPVRKTREGWDKAFKSMHSRKEDALFIEDSVDLEMKDWEW